MKTYYVTIITAKEKQKTVEEVFYEDDMIGVARCLLGYKPKRGYEFVTAHVDYVEGLV